MIRHWLTVFDVAAVICIDRGTQFVGAWCRTISKDMGVTLSIAWGRVAYSSPHTPWSSHAAPSADNHV